MCRVVLLTTTTTASIRLTIDGSDRIRHSLHAGPGEAVDL